MPPFVKVGIPLVAEPPDPAIIESAPLQATPAEQWGLGPPALAGVPS